MGLPGYKNPAITGQLATTIPSSVTFTRSGNVPSDSYLNIGSVISNATGFPVRVTDGLLSFVSVQNELANTFSIDIIEWDGVAETIKATVNVTSALGADFVPVSEIPLTSGNSLRCKVSSGSCKNPVVLVYIVGDVPV